MNKIIGKPIFWAVLLSALLLPFLILSFYCHPSADDYIFAAQVKKMGGFAYFDLIYHSWSGRYFSTFIKFFNPLVYDWLWGYKLIPFFLIILFVTSIYFFVKIIFPIETTKTKRIIISLSFVLLYFNIMPSTPEGIYWIESSINYLFANTLLIFFFTIIFKNWNSTKIKIVDYLIIFTMPIMIVGSNEISMLALNEFLFILIIYQFLITKKINKLLIIPFIIAFISTIIEITAPGNYMRMTSSFSLNSDILLSLKLCIISFVKISIKFLQDPGFLIASILYFALIPLFNSSSFFREHTNISPFISIPISILIILSLYFPVLYSTGIPVALRVHDTVGLFILFGWFYNLSALYNYFIKKQKIRTISASPFYIQLIGIVAITLVILDFKKEPDKDIYPRGNIFCAGYDLLFSAKTYDNELRNRENLILKSVSENIKYLEVPPLSIKPSSIHFIDISDKTSDWINISVAAYYGLDSIKIYKP